MNRNSGNVSKTKRSIPGVSNNSKHNRKLYQNLSDSSSISSNKNSSAHSEEEISCVYLRPQEDNNVSNDEQEQIVKKLQTQVKELRHKLRILEESLDSKDYSLGTIAREKDRAIGEIRRLERSNKQLRQQLNDERNHYLEEKEKFCDEMTKCKKRLQESKLMTEKKNANQSSKQSLINQSLKWQYNKEKGDFSEPKTTSTDLKSSKSQKLLGVRDKKSIHLSTFSFSDCQIHKPTSIESLHLYEGDDVSLQLAALRTENAKLRSIIMERDERNYELCLRFLRMKHYKNDIRNRFQDLENEYLQVITNLMDKIDEARQEFNFIIDQKFKRPLHSTNAMYLQIVQRNSKMAFENASLRLENQCLKKELNKHLNSSAELDRKSDFGALVDDLEAKMNAREQKTNEKMKRPKKNVNFNAIQTIYERDMNLKNSDTDSNYMSKTTTTAPSNVSLGEPKSSESVMVEKHSSQNNTVQPNFQASSLPNEILNKIFKRVDTSSCQTVDTGRSKEKNKNDTKSKNIISEETKLDYYETDKYNLNSEKESNKGSQKDIMIIEYKSPPRLTDSSTPSESKESLRLNATKGMEITEYVDSKTKEPTERAQTERKLWSFKNKLKSQVRGGWNFDKHQVTNYKPLELSVRKFNLMGRKEIGRGEKIQPKTNLKTKQFVDNCGLTEKLEFSDLDFSTTALVKPPVQSTVEGIKLIRENPESANPRIEMIESEDESLGLRSSRRQLIKNITPAIGSRSRSSNKINLQDELMEAVRNQPKFETQVSLKKEIKPSSPKKKNENDDCNVSKNIQDEITEVIQHDKEIKNSEREQEMTQYKKAEGSKRFSHRLISTSPEQLRNILTESQMGTFQMDPVTIGHATTDITPTFNYEDVNNEELPQLATSPKSQVASEVNEGKGKTYVSLVFPQTSTNSIRDKTASDQAEISNSEIKIPISSLQTSNTTMEMIESIACNRNNMMMRTLSAPGLLESCWLDPFTLCEMRDCGTNT